ncbi:enoyl-CoA hydratase [Aestuariibacter halophilus]|uniref:Enoyl-CoA hydratase n=1 Tax=Fluctibacter halophilus TaxID=226011 RepID=A0ABS8G5A7_9ALTE|nr:enoyl-CoA hydratase [Aestuariibacter halophilus]MCC2615762.1 enoyl-CoA hydratase [Aestuariibacter halophilus]
MSELVRIKVEQSVHRITLARAEKKNALNQRMYGLLADALEVATQDPQAKVVVLSADGDCFTAGNDMQDFAAAGESEQVGETVRFMRALMDCPLPVVAEVRGLAVGIGTTLLLHCDLVVCADNARFSLPFVNLGLVPEYASSYLLPKLAGHRKASRWLMLAEPFGASDAEQCGIVSHVVPDSALSECLEQVVTQLVGKPRQALLHTKSLMKQDQDAVLLHMNDELDLFIEQMASAPAQEAFRAFLEKRQPDPSIYR